MRRWATVAVVATASMVVGLNSGAVIANIAPGLSEAMSLAVMLCTTALAAVIISYVRRPQRFRRTGLALRDRCADGSILAMTQMAGFLAGWRRAHLREAWAADLYGDPKTSVPPGMSRRLSLAAGDVVAALRCRLDNAVMTAWRPADALLASYHASRIAIVTPVTVAAGLVLSHEGFYGLITNAENLGVIAAAPYAAIKVLRKYRQISTPKRPEKKTESASGPER